ncbi:MAG TPA: SHOCT domain-containing protein [Acidimicrobiia bacterium]|nr:SHOCT domain-containing protein [Acidimicrobiia bacterium]
MPYALPRSREQQDAYNEQLRRAYSSTQRVESSGRDPLARVRELADLHQSGALTDDEFAAAKARVLGLDDAR